MCGHQGPPQSSLYHLPDLVTCCVLSLTGVQPYLWTLALTLSSAETSLHTHASQVLILMTLLRPSLAPRLQSLLHFPLALLTIQHTTFFSPADSKLPGARGFVFYSLQTLGPGAWLALQEWSVLLSKGLNFILKSQVTM